MTPKNVATIACRLLAIWFFVQAMKDFATAINGYLLMRSAYISAPPSPIGSPPFMQSPLPFVVLPSVTHLGACVVLWLGAPILAKNMTRDLETSTSPPSEGGASSWQNVGFSLIGAGFLFQGLSTLSSYFGVKFFMAPSNFTTMFDSQATRLWQQNALAVSQCFFGFVLLLWSQKTLRALDYLQRGGRDQIPQVTNDNAEN